jgi:hypothetical protein
MHALSNKCIQKFIMNYYIELNYGSTDTKQTLTDCTQRHSERCQIFSLLNYLDIQTQNELFADNYKIM